MQKFSSNVVEKLIECIVKKDFSTKSLFRKRIIEEFFKPMKIINLIKNRYGAFVTQKIIKIMSEEEKAEIKSYLKEKINITSTKEKQHLLNLFELLKTV